MKKRYITLLLAAAMTIGSTITAFAYDWIQDETGWRYGEHNGFFWDYKAGWEEIEGKWYYFDYSTYYMEHDKTIDGYTLGSDGAWNGNQPIIPDESDKKSPFVPAYTYTFLSGGPNTENLIWPETGYKFKINGEYLKNQWVRIYDEPEYTDQPWMAYVYVDENGISLKSETKDGFTILDTGCYVPPAYNSETGKRGFLVGDTITPNINTLEERVDTNGNTYYLLDSNTTSLSFVRNPELNEELLSICFTTYKYNPDSNTIYPFSNDGIAIDEDFFFEKKYDF